MLRFEDIVFGPVRSRRLGASLGINLLPPKGKLCNFDCIYCECGWNRDGMQDRSMPDAEDVRSALERNLSRLASEGVKVDSITFSGNGEPTLNPAFPEIMEITTALRDKYYPEAKVSVLSNATQVKRPEIFEALRKADNPILKIDAPYDSLAYAVNRPAPGYHVAEIVENLSRFEGDFILQTMFMRGSGTDSSSADWLSGWMEIVERLSPREIMVYTLDRETPEKGLYAFSVEEMTALVAPLAEKGFNIQIRG